MPFTTMREVLFGSSSSDRSLDRQSQSGCVPVQEDDALSKVTQNVPSAGFHLLRSDIYGQEQQHANYHQQLGLLPNMLEAPQLEFVGHNIACAPNIYYGGMMAGYGPPLVPPRFVEAPTKMLLAHEVTQKPVYVNAKQYHAIQRRRESRKAALERKLVKDRKPYLHESRQQHAVRRFRGTGSRLGKRSEGDSLNNTTASASGSGSASAETPSA